MEAALRTISEGTAALTGLDFFRTVARLAAETLDGPNVLVAEALGERKELVSTLAFCRCSRPARRDSSTRRHREAVIARRNQSSSPRHPGALPGGS